jgi:hypothetical protein
MARLGPQYATVNRFRDVSGQTNLDDERDEYFGALVRAASRALDRETGRWFNRRPATISVHGIPNGSFMLFLPVPIVSLTSVTENGTVLVEDTDFYRFKSWLEKPSGSTWYTEPFKIDVAGVFGEEAVDDDIQILVCAIAAAEGELRKRTFVNEEGSVSEIPTSSFPKWVKDQVMELAKLKCEPTPHRVVFS